MDGLSRIVNHQQGSSTALLLSFTALTTLQLQDLYKEIEEDTYIQEVLGKIVAGESVKDGYYLVDGKLFYRLSLVIPTTSKHIPLILQECHDGVLSGHSGVLKTMKRIQSCFFIGNR